MPIYPAGYTDADVLAIAAALIHAARHENGGADEVSIAALSGLAADDQHVLDAEVLAVASDLAHAARHEIGGADSLRWTAAKLLLGAGVGADPTEVDLPSGGYTEGARVTHDANQSVNDSTNFDIAFNSESVAVGCYDTDNIHDTVTNNGRLTCKTAGKYVVVLSLRWDDNDTGERKVSILHNNSPRGAQEKVASRFSAVTLCAILDLEVNEYCHATAWQTSGGTLNIKGNEYISPIFAMQRIG